MKVQRVYFMLMVQDMDRAMGFYRDAIGLDPRMQSRNWSELGSENTVVALHSGSDGEYRLTGLGFGVDDVVAACQQVTSGGGRIIKPPEEREGEGIILARVADTEGNGISLTQRTS